MDAPSAKETTEAPFLLSLSLVNDDPAQLMVQRRLLGRIAEVVAFQSPLEALVAARTRALPPNLITDFHMPGMDGPELAQAWCDLVPQAKVLVVSASQVSPAEQARTDALPTEAVRLVTSYRILELVDHAMGWFAQPVETQDSTDPTETELVLDRTVLEKLGKLGGETFVAKTVARFSQSAPEKIQAIAEALGRSDLARMHELSHSLKGSCGLVGAVALSQAADAIESATAPDLPEPVSGEQLAQDVDRLRAESLAVLAQLEQFHL